MKSGSRRAPLGAALYLIGTLAAADALAQPQPNYRGAAPEALVRAAAYGPVTERPAVLEALLESRGAALPTLRDEARRGVTRDSRLAAIGMLVEMRDRDGVPALLDAAGDTDEQIQRGALAALRTLADPRAVTRFRQVVRKGTSAGAVKIAAAGLGRIGNGTDLASLRALLASGDEGVRVTAAGALAMLGSDEGTQVLLDAIAGDNALAQKNATYALGFVHTAEAAAKLQEIVDDPDGRWKSYAVIALAERGLPAQQPDEQIATLALLGRGRDRIAADWAIEQLTDSSHRDATEVLREIGTRKGPIGMKARLRLKLREGR